MKTTTKLIIVTVATMMLGGCDPSGEAYKPVPDSVLPEGLKDCTFYRVTPANQATLHIIRCPNSSTTTITSGKTPVTVNTTEDAPAEKSSNELAVEKQRMAEEARQAEENHQHEVDEALRKAVEEVDRLRALKSSHQ